MVTVQDYVSKTNRSRALYENAKTIFPAGVSYKNRYIEPYPFYVERASGSKLVDVDGNIYTDYWCTHFALILGHAHPHVLDAIKAQAEKDWHYGLEHELQIQHAKKINRHVRSAEMIRYTSSGSEANMYAVRLARTFTKRKKIGKFQGNWHGGVDPLFYAFKPPLDQPPSGGLSASAIQEIVVLPYNDLDRAARMIETNELSSVSIEPVMGAGGMIPADHEFLKGLREVCDQTGTVLIFDEVITGFRLGLKSAQGYYGVYPDITVMGKIIGGGLPIGAVAGRRELMEHMDHTKYTADDYCFHGGTFAATALSLAAGLATIQVLETEPVYDKLEKLGRGLRNGLNGVFENRNISAQATGVGSLVGIHFTKTKPIRDIRAYADSDHEMSKRLFKHLLDNGILVLIPELLHAALSSAHTEDEIRRLIDSADEFLRRG